MTKEFLISISPIYPIHQVSDEKPQPYQHYIIPRKTKNKSPQPSSPDHLGKLLDIFA